MKIANINPEIEAELRKNIGKKVKVRVRTQTGLYIDPQLVGTLKTYTPVHDTERVGYSITNNDIQVMFVVESVFQVYTHETDILSIYLQ